MFLSMLNLPAHSKSLQLDAPGWRDAAARPRYYRDKRSRRYFPASRSVVVVSLPLQLPKLHRCNPPAGFVKFSHRPYVTSIRKSFCSRRPMVAVKANEVLKEDLISQSGIGLYAHTFHNMTPYAEFYEFSWIFPSFFLSVATIIAIEIFQRSRCTYALRRVFSIARSRK